MNVEDSDRAELRLAAVNIVRESVRKWTGLLPRSLQIAWFRRLADNNAVLGSTQQRTKFTATPIISAMQSQKATIGAVNVAVVPNGLGKTTAAGTFL